MEAGAIRTGADPAELAAQTGLPVGALEETLTKVESYRRGAAEDPLGRNFAGNEGFTPPYYAVRVTGALFHTQGGLCVDHNARVVTGNGKALPNLFAGGGAARGVSGARVEGYLSGNGLLTAVALGALAGQAATL